MTYSLSVTGLNANSAQAAKPLTLSDDQGRIGGQQLAMAQGTYFLCKNPDGSQSYYRLDSHRSTPANPVLIAVGP
jgi:hypothetical protein